MFERCCCQSANICLVAWKCCQEQIEIRNRGQQHEIYEQEKVKKKKKENVKQKLYEGVVDHI